MADVSNEGTSFPFKKSSQPNPNFKGSGTKKNVKGNPNSSPWTGGANRGADYTRTSSNKQGVGPAKPSASIPGSIAGETAVTSRAGQAKHI